MKLLLASKSPRRRELLAQLGFPIEYVSIEVDERLAPSTPPLQAAEMLARRKADAYQGSLSDDEVLVTADTVVLLGNRILGKPANADEASQMLHSLSGHSHTVCTGVCLHSKQLTHSFTESTEVHFRTLGDEEIQYYISHYRPFDKAGAYGIQEWIGMVGVSRIEGCYYNVMGLPLARLYSELSSKFGSI